MHALCDVTDITESSSSGLHAETDKALKEAVYNRLADQSKYETLQAENEVSNSIGIPRIANWALSVLVAVRTFVDPCCLIAL